MTALLWVISGVALWALVPLPLAVVVGRAFRAGAAEDSFVQISRDYDTSRDYDAVGM